MKLALERVAAAIRALQQGEMIILTDPVQRENEGDLVIAAEHITTEKMNFFIRQGAGVVCVAMAAALAEKLDIPLMVPTSANTSACATPFGMSIDARVGITSGVSAADRTTTVLAMLRPQASAHDFVRPGHMFPLLAQPNGVFARQGHTEGAVDLMLLAECKPAAVIAEVMNPDGSMARGATLKQFAEAHGLLQLSIEDIMLYRLHQESSIAEEITTELPLAGYGDFMLTIAREKYTHDEHVILTNNVTTVSPPLVRIHSACATGDIFASQRCDCHQQLHYALTRISQAGGLLIYLQQEGRGIGLFNKIQAYALQTQGYDTVEANEKLGFPADLRSYHVAAHFLRQRGIQQVRLMTNNPGKIQHLLAFGITQVEPEPMPLFLQEHNQRYLSTKREKLHHVY